MAYSGVSESQFQGLHHLKEMARESFLMVQISGLEEAFCVTLPKPWGNGHQRWWLYSCALPFGLLEVPSRPLNSDSLPCNLQQLNLFTPWGHTTQICSIPQNKLMTRWTFQLSSLPQNKPWTMDSAFFARIVPRATFLSTGPSKEQMHRLYPGLIGLWGGLQERVLITLPCAPSPWGHL